LFDIDGEGNSYQKGKLTTALDTPRKSMWGVAFETVPSELLARTKINPVSPSNFYSKILVIENAESGLGHHPAYQLYPSGSYSYSLLSLDDIPVARNPYIDSHIYVTPYDPTQVYAGGEYPVQSKGNDTLHTWTAADRSILNEDIVTWYTMMGFHHVPRMEDWPVMPTHWATVELRPFNFFKHNPAISSAEQSSADTATDETSEDSSSVLACKVWFSAAAAGWLGVFLLCGL
jgi:primary-amine oxidase